MNNASSAINVAIISGANFSKELPMVTVHEPVLGSFSNMVNQICKPVANQDDLIVVLGYSYGKTKDSSGFEGSAEARKARVLAPLEAKLADLSVKPEFLHFAFQGIEYLAFKEAYTPQIAAQLGATQYDSVSALRKGEGIDEAERLAKNNAQPWVELVKKYSGNKENALASIGQRA